ncbi:2Fe-2S iron-sulfur cluster-binding family protein [Flavobacterium nackdongense]|uniref:2Fe-2S iron-sulfur cluster binding domain-containing protein n=1 Tax=Flavobacterium nackdongense TaxID=2547394 RepID=A0A4V1AGS1_9FLAO|nr:2Fe-2S iron-sulfur cluster-binding protein [Flavobacterium nackdongense]QBN19022.1 2Fe-2S iron-sulfur cluster binding domain-containing protein [Flavobacterium nackdongense]
MDITIKIKNRKGELHEVKAPTDMSLNLMHIVRAYELEPNGTIGLCGGNAMCHTCQCYATNNVDLPEKKEAELATLSRLPNAKTNSRLSCQIPVTPALEGLEIEIAPLF